MKLKIEFVDDTTGDLVILKNKGDKVLYHNSSEHEHKEFEDLTGQIKKFSEPLRTVVDAFYTLAGKVM
jgi:hypothetical protein